MVVAQKKKPTKKSVVAKQDKEAAATVSMAEVIPLVPLPQETLGVAGQLKKARLSQNLSILQVSQELRIRRDYLKAIEEETFDRLPEQAYTIGFVRSYANFLGFDGVKLARAYRQERDLKVQLPLVDRLSDLSEAATPSRSQLVISCLGAAVLLLGGWFFWGIKKERAPLEELPPSSMESQKEPSLPGNSPMATLGDSAPSTPSVVSEPPIASPAPVFEGPLDAGQGRLHAKDKVWVKVYELGGKIHKDVVLEAGESLSVPLNDKIFLSTGNAGALTLEWEGKTVPFKGKHGEVKRHVPLEATLVQEHLSPEGE